MNELHLTILGNGRQDVYWCHGVFGQGKNFTRVAKDLLATCLLYTSPSPRDVEESRMPSSA